MSTRVKEPVNYSIRSRPRPTRPEATVMYLTVGDTVPAAAMAIETCVGWRVMHFDAAESGVWPVDDMETARQKLVDIGESMRDETEAGR